MNKSVSALTWSLACVQQPFYHKTSIIRLIIWKYMVVKMNYAVQKLFWWILWLVFVSMRGLKQIAIDLEQQRILNWAEDVEQQREDWQVLASPDVLNNSAKLSAHYYGFRKRNI